MDLRSGSKSNAAIWAHRLFEITPLLIVIVTSQCKPFGLIEELLIMAKSANNKDDGEKEGKLKNMESQRMKNVFIFLGALCLVFVLAVVSLNPSGSLYSPTFLRQKDEKSSSGSNKHHRRTTTFLPPNSIYRLSAEDGKGKMTSLEKYAGKVSLIVNVASKWGYTQVSYEEMATLQKTYGPQGFQVLAFPTNDFHQEYEDNEDIQDFVKRKFPQVTFPVMGISPLAENPVYRQLHRAMPHKKIKWNFFKYLVNHEGVPVAFYNMKQSPLDISDDIEELLSAKENPHHYTTH